MKFNVDNNTIAIACVGIALIAGVITRQEQIASNAISAIAGVVTGAGAMYTTMKQ